MIQVAKIIGTGLVRTNLIEAGVKISIEIGARRKFSNSHRVLTGNSDEEKSRILDELNNKGDDNFNEVLKKSEEVVKLQKTLAQIYNTEHKSQIINEHDNLELKTKNMWKETSSIINKDENTGSEHVSVKADKALINTESTYLSYQSLHIDNADTIIKNSPRNSTIAQSFLETYHKKLEERDKLIDIQRSVRIEQLSKLDEVKEYDGDSKPSLLDEYADVSTEAPDYTGGDD